MSKKYTPKNVTIDMAEEIDDDPKVFYQIDKWYTINVNPLDSWQCLNNTDRLKSFQSKIHEVMLEVFNTTTMFRYNIEISEPHGVVFNKYPRLHVHGRFMFKKNDNILQFLLYGMRKLNEVGRIDIKPVDSCEEWDKYCTKYVHIMKIDTYSNFIQSEEGDKVVYKVRKLDAIKQLQPDKKVYKEVTVQRVEPKELPNVSYKGMFKP